MCSKRHNKLKEEQAVSGFIKKCSESTKRYTKFRDGRVARDFFMECVKGGVYDGPEEFYCRSTLYFETNHRIKSLGNLKTFDGDLKLVGIPLESLGDLENINGTLHIGGTKITSAPNLKFVRQELSYWYQDIPVFEKLEYVYKLSIAGMIDRDMPRTVPFLPSLKLDCEVEYFDESMKRKSGYYSEFVKEVLSKPVEMLIPLRSEKPVLANLIDARLRGDL